jgi:hypothetical protein
MSLIAISRIASFLFAVMWVLVDVVGKAEAPADVGRGFLPGWMDGWIVYCRG